MSHWNRHLLRFASAVAIALFASTIFPAEGDAQLSINRNLKIGDHGQDVLALQQFLNRDAWTRVTQSGPGSPGSETTFFGQKTKEAVARFQEKYASELLAPIGLTRGTGFVGTLTRRKIGTLLAATLPAGGGPAIPPSVVSTSSSSQTASNNPNLVNLEPFLEEVARAQEKNGASKAQADKIVGQIRTDAMTMGDFKKEFVRRELEAEAKKRSVQSNSAWRDILVASFKKVDPFVNIAHAQSGLAFGGMITYVYTCTCANTSIIYVSPPSQVQTLDYVNGTQAYQSYNLPYATWVLGLYEPGMGGTCYIYVGEGCSLVSSGGIVSNTVGSSAT